MRQTLFLLFLISAFSFGQSIPSGFQLIAYEGFDYSNGTNISNQGGGSGWSSNWAANYYGNSSMYVYSSGYSYSGLTTNGNRLEWGGSGQYQPHAVKRSVTSPNSGIVYFQFISDFRSTSGGGTDNIRFYKGGALQGGVGGNGSPHTINILDSGLSNGISSGSAIGDQSLVVMRINYDSNTTELWVNPNLSSFDYVNPGSADAQAAYDIEFDQIELVFRSGASIDEISVFNLIPLPEISQTKIALNNSTVSVTFSEGVYGGTANATSTLEVSDFELSISGGSASLSSSTPSSIIVSGTTIGLGIPLSGTPDGSELLTILPASNSSIFGASGNSVSTTQSSNTVQLIWDIVSSGLVLYLDAANQNSFSGSGSTWHDLSPNQNDGIISGTTFSSNGGEGFIFGGSSSDYITVADDTSLDMDNNQMTISYEITPDLNGSNWSPAIQKGVSATACGVGTLNYYTWYGNNDLKIDFEGNSDLRGQLYNATSDDILNGKKIMITITVDQSNAVKTYINGELKHILNHSGQVLGSTTNGPLVIGYCPDPSGKISSIMIYDRALNGQEIFKNYDALNDITPSDISLTSNTISETASLGSLIGTLSATDSDTSISSLTFSFTSSGDARDDDNNSFTISGTSLLTSTTLDYETKASYNIYINVNDGANDFAKAFTVSVTNILEPITDLGFEVASIVTDGLILHLDASNSNSYSGSGNTWYDISGNNNHGTLNGPTFSNTGLKHFVFNGTDDVTSLNLSNYSDLTFEFWFYDNRTSGQRDLLTYNGNAGSFTFRNMNHFRTDGNGLSAAQYPTSLVSNQWVRFVYVKNTKIFINNTKTNISSGSDRTYGQLKIGDARSDVGQHWDGKIALVRIYNRSLTDQEIEKNYEVFDKVVNNNQQLGTSSSTVSVDEEVSAGTLVANLTATDSDTTSFTFSLVAGDGINDRNNSSFTVSGTQLLVAGNIDYETNSSLNIYIQASDGTNTFAKALTVNVNDVNEPPVITATTLAQDNSSVDVTFSEAVNASADASNTLALEVSDFVLSLQGGTATLSATTPLSISANGNTYTLGLPLVGISDGTEVLTVQPASNAIYDLGAAVASTTQSSNTVTLNPPNAAPSDISLSSSAVNENVSIGTLVAVLSTTDTDGSDTHTYSLVSGTGDTDNARFSINGVNLLTAAAVDYESQNSFSILLQTSDGTATYTESFTISVIDGEDDSDGDGIFDNSDAFPSDASEWSDNDGDGTGDNADTDDDNDGWSDTVETSCNTNPLSSSETPSDFDQDGNPDCLDPDDDNDTYPDLEDTFPFNAEEWADNDEDGTGDNADTDDDNDGYLDADEIQCESDPLDSSSLPLDFDVDGAPDCIDDNDDNDYCLDVEDDFPLNRDLCVDTDGDGIDNRYEFDSDNDGVADTRDAFPLDPNESQDTDGDGIGDNEDQDDNNDGFSDEAPIISKVITPNQPGVESTWKIINIEDYPFTTVRVYAPDGSIVFESTNYQNQWRGNNMRTGSPLPTGPYYFRISYGSVLEKVEDGWLYIFN